MNERSVLLPLVLIGVLPSLLAAANEPLQEDGARDTPDAFVGKATCRACHPLEAGHWDDMDSGVDGPS